jgi:hypothetical protein
MKHLKKFNESLEPVEIDELKDFCETSLAYLLDDGYQVSVYESRFKDVSVRDKVKYPEKEHTIVSLGLKGKMGYRLFDWNDIKDYYIPFLQMLVRRYELLPFGMYDKICYFNTEGGFRYLSLDQVINDRVGSELGSRLWGINIMIVDKI